MADASLKTTLQGVGYGCLSTTLGGMTVALTRFIIEDTDPFSLASSRYFAGAVVLLGLMVWRMGLPPILRKDWLAFFVLGVVMFAVFPYFMARALEDTTSARGGIIFGSMPLLTMLIAVTFRVERFGWYKALGILVGFAGAAIVLSEKVDAIAPEALRGDMFMIAGMICASSFNVFSKKYLMRYGSMPVNVYAMLIGSVTLFVAALFLGNPLGGSLAFDATGWFVFFMLAIPGGTIMMVSWGKAIQLISPTQAAVTVSLNPVAAIAIAAVILAEPVTANVIIGFPLVVLAIFIANYRPRTASGSGRA